MMLDLGSWLTQKEAARQERIEKASNVYDLITFYPSSSDC
jgi:hypothetical protein